MRKTGVIKNKIKTTYKIAIGLNIFTVLGYLNIKPIGTRSYDNEFYKKV